MIGVLFGAAPMVTYQVVYGDISQWASSSFLSGLAVSQRAFFDEASYLDTPRMLVDDLRSEAYGIALQQGLYWFLLLLLPVAFGVYATRMHWLQTLRNPRMQSVGALVLCYGYVSYYYQIPLYLYSTIPLFVVGWLLYYEVLGDGLRRAVYAGIVFLSLASVTTMSFIPYTLRCANILVYPDVPHVSVRTPLNDARAYERLYVAVRTYAKHGDSIYVFPLNPDLYYVTKTTPPFASYGSALELQTYDDLNVHTDRLTTEPVSLLVFNKGSKYVGPLETQLYEQLVSGGYAVEMTVGHTTLLVPVERGKTKVRYDM
jgi:hypothetical protein